MMQPVASYQHHQLQLKILNCSDDSARHSEAETKIAVRIAMAHIEQTNTESGERR